MVHLVCHMGALLRQAGKTYLNSFGELIPQRQAILFSIQLTFM